MNRPRVFVVNLPVDSEGRPKIDLSTAEEHGDLAFLLPPGRLTLDMAAIVRDLEVGLASFTPQDYLVGVGDMAACLAAASIATKRTNGHYQILRWNDRARRYAAVPLDLGKW